jgi:hypothetical protein
MSWHDTNAMAAAACGIAPARRSTSRRVVANMTVDGLSREDCEVEVKADVSGGCGRIDEIQIRSVACLHCGSNLEIDRLPALILEQAEEAVTADLEDDR